MPEDCDHEIDNGDARNSEHVAPADEVPGWKVGERRGDLVRITLDEEIEGRAVDDQGNEGGDEGAQPQISDQEAVDSAEEGTEHNRGGGGSDDRRTPNAERIEREETRQREHLSDRKVDAADDYDEPLAERDEADLARLTGGVRQ